MFGECHAHIFMDGKNYKKAVELHKKGVQDDDIRAKLEVYKAAGVTFIRDGGDALGVSERARELAPEYGITYRTPLFAIHQKGHYGGIVGHGFATMQEYRALVKEADRRRGDFIKVMFSGIMDFANEGSLTETPVEKETIREMIHIAHEEGFAVMAHVNGPDAVLHAVEGGVDSVEHGNFVDETCLLAMKEYGTIWVPTYVTITNLIGCGRFDDAGLMRLKERQGAMIRRGYEMGVNLGLGSDAGAYMVPHGKGIQDEYEAFRKLTDDAADLDERLHQTEAKIGCKFCRG